MVRLFSMPLKCDEHFGLIIVSEFFCTVSVPQRLVTNNISIYVGGLMFITLHTQSPKLTTFSYSSSVFFTKAWFCRENMTHVKAIMYLLHMKLFKCCNRKRLDSLTKSTDRFLERLFEYKIINLKHWERKTTYSRSLQIRTYHLRLKISSFCWYLL